MIQILLGLSGNVLRYLKQIFEGEPRELVNGCLHIKDSYTEDTRLLTEMHGDPHKISHVYIKKVTYWPFIKHEDLCDESYSVPKCDVLACVSLSSGSPS